MSEVNDILHNHIYPNLDRRTALSKLEPIEREDFLELTCPDCGERRAYIYKNGTKIICNRGNNCSYNKSIWDYIQTSQGLNKQETLKELARLANYELPKGQIDHKKLEESERKKNLFETAQGFFHKALFSQGGEETLRYLTEIRGYTEAEIKEVGLGYYPGYDKTRDFLNKQGFNHEEIESLLSYGKDRDEHKVILPYRNESREILTFIVRITRELKDGEKQSRKYLPLSHYKRTCLFNSDKVKNWNEIIIVEGYLDAPTATTNGIENVVATGSRSLENKQFESLVNHKVKHVSLCFDMDEAGQDGTERAIDKLTGKGIDSYIISLPKGAKDPDELIRKHGAEAFNEAVKNAQDGWKWKAERFISKHDITTDIGKNRCLGEGIGFLNGLPSYMAIKHGENFIRHFSNLLGYSEACIKAEWDTIQEREAREQERKAIERFHQQGAELLRQGKLIEAREHLQQVTELRGKALRESITPYTYETLLEEARRTPPGLKIGYEIMDKVITIPNEAITIIAARTSHGKTTFMMNLLLNMLELYPDKAFFFFSYEETRQQVGFKLINILSGDIIYKDKNNEEVTAYCLRGAENREKIEAGKAKFREYTESGRLWIIEENYRAEDLTNVLSYIKERHEVGAVFIDYIQKIKAKGKFGTRQLELQEVSSQILEAAKNLSIPIILGAQLGRDKGMQLDNLREAGDIEQDANLVLGVCKKTDDFKKTRIELTILKNRNGRVDKEPLVFDFNLPILTIREPGEKNNQNNQKETRW